MNKIAYLISLPYLRWHIIFTFIPLIILISFNYKYIFKYKRTLFFTFLIFFIWGFIFDEIASVWLKVWVFNTATNLRIYFLGLPIEEYIFLFFIPIELGIFFLLIRRKLYG